MALGLPYGKAPLYRAIAAVHLSCAQLARFASAALRRAVPARRTGAAAVYNAPSVVVGPVR
jgi:hypothetical protein